MLLKSIIFQERTAKVFSKLSTWLFSAYSGVVCVWSYTTPLHNVANCLDGNTFLSITKNRFVLCETKMFSFSNKPVDDRCWHLLLACVGLSVKVFWNKTCIDATFILRSHCLTLVFHKINCATQYHIKNNKEKNQHFMFFGCTQVLHALRIRNNHPVSDCLHWNSTPPALLFL